MSKLDHQMPSENQTSQILDVTLRGYVEKIIPPLVPGESIKIQISIPSADDLFREIRIPVELNGCGPDSVPSEDSEVEIVIRARARNGEGR